MESAREKNRRTYLGAEGDLDGIGELVNTSKHTLAGSHSEADVLCGIVAHLGAGRRLEKKPIRQDVLKTCVNQEVRVEVEVWTCEIHPLESAKEQELAR